MIDIAHCHADAALGVGENRDEARDLDELTACEPEDLDGRQAARIGGNSEFGLAIAIEVAGRDERTAAEASQDRGWREDVGASCAVDNPHSRRGSRTGREGKSAMPSPSKSPTAERIAP